jgi:two-component system sensor histidine kinase DesK
VLGAVAITVTGVALYGQGWRDPGWVAGAIIAVSTRGRLRVVALLTLLGGLAVYDTTLTHHYMPDASTATIAWYFFYTATISVMGTAALAGCARLIDLLGRLDEARELHVAATVERERRRSWADLHDVLGHTMTAIALRADLARRVLAGDPARAATELEDLVGLASAQADELRAVARGDRSLRFAIEAASAVRLLRQAGVQVLCELDVDHLDDRGDAVLGSAAREGSTNILRHAQARRCVMRARRDGDRVVFELRNDGVLAAPGSGTGLRGLAERARGCHGSVVAGPEDDGWFALRVSVPLRGSA